ncbi:MAG: TRAP transporter substrate-binding protein [Treponema sp.]|nr:TRAP transporter substrate-binding protein [Treponema sp.]
MRRLSIIFLTCILILNLFSCKKNEYPKNKTKQIIMRLAETHPKDYPTTRANQKFADLVEIRTNGRIKIEVFHSSQLGQEREVIEQVQFGGIDFSRVSCSPITNISPLFNALQFPYVFTDSEHQWKVLNSEIGDKLFESLEEHDLIGLCWYDSGARNFYNSVKEISKPEDLRGMKIRVQQSDMMVDMLTSLGAIATPMGYQDVSAGLQTGFIEGAENNWPSYESTKHYKFAKYYTLDEHSRVPEIMIASKLVMKKLSLHDQQIIKQAAKDTMQYQIKEWEKEEKKAEQIVRAQGCIITKVTDKKLFQKAMEPIFEKQTTETQKLIRQIQNKK